MRVVAFARIREIVGGEQALALDAPATVGGAWDALAGRHPALAPLASSTRFARNGTFVTRESALDEGDELALLPPFGGG